MKSLSDYTYEEFQEMPNEDQKRLYRESSLEELETWEEKYKEEGEVNMSRCRIWPLTVVTDSSKF